MSFLLPWNWGRKAVPSPAAAAAVAAVTAPGAEANQVTAPSAETAGAPSASAPSAEVASAPSAEAASAPSARAPAPLSQKSTPDILLEFQADSSKASGLVCANVAQELLARMTEKRPAGKKTRIAVAVVFE